MLLIYASCDCTAVLLGQDAVVKEVFNLKTVFSTGYKDTFTKSVFGRMDSMLYGKFFC